MGVRLENILSEAREMQKQEYRLFEKIDMFKNIIDNLTKYKESGNDLDNDNVYELMKILGRFAQEIEENEEDNELLKLKNSTYVNELYILNYKVKSFFNENLENID